jgi:8-amino-7-oxononanoate synthase
VSYLRRVSTILDQIRAENLYRTVGTHQISGLIDFSSNDYLGLAADSQVVQALRHATRAGSGGARLLGGRHREHSLLEEELASWLGREAALLFSSGYLAALGGIAALAQTVQAIYSDERNHASIIDGVRSSHLPRHIYPHGMLPSRAERDCGALVASESIFSMGGDSVDPGGLLAKLGDDDVLFLDEAHAFGVVGSEGSGLARPLADERVVVMGTLSKSLGAQGGFVAGPAPVIELLINRARTFIFDTALPPAIALAARIALTLTRRGDDRRASLHANVAQLRAGLRQLGYSAIDTPSPIVPLVLGTEERALDVAAHLFQRRIFAPAIRPPTVGPGGSRIRFSIRADHTPEQIDLVLGALAQCTVTS